MSRINAIEPNDAAPEARALLEAAEQKMGMIPNILKGLANSPVALDAYMSLSGILGGGSLRPRLREQIALATAGANACDYCAAAHTAIGKSLKVDESELQRNLAAESSDPRTAAALTFVSAVIEQRGIVGDEALQAVREAGFSDAEIVEVIANIALNTLTNFFNGVARTEVDFPRVELAAV